MGVGGVKGVEEVHVVVVLRAWVGQMGAGGLAAGLRGAVEMVLAVMVVVVAMGMVAQEAILARGVAREAVVMARARAREVTGVRAAAAVAAAGRGAVGWVQAVAAVMALVMGPSAVVAVEGMATETAVEQVATRVGRVGAAAKRVGWQVVVSAVV